MFDDSFSALDFKTDARLRQALKQEVADSAVIIVAQRISTIVDADQIIVLEDGGMAGIGTHEELMEKCEVYREIVRSQDDRQSEGNQSGTVEGLPEEKKETQENENVKTEKKNGRKGGRKNGR